MSCDSVPIMLALILKGLQGQQRGTYKGNKDLRVWTANAPVSFTKTSNLCFAGTSMADGDPDAEFLACWPTNTTTDSGPVPDSAWGVQSPSVGCAKRSAGTGARSESIAHGGHDSQRFECRGSAQSLPRQRSKDAGFASPAVRSWSVLARVLPCEWSCCRACSYWGRLCSVSDENQLLGLALCMWISLSKAAVMLGHAPALGFNEFPASLVEAGD